MKKRIFHRLRAYGRECPLRPADGRGADRANGKASRRLPLVAFALAVAVVLPVRAQRPLSWRPAKAPLLTRWAAEVSPTNVLPDYPRPQMERADWKNLNGLWDYAVTADSAGAPAAYAGKILVPFPIESALSGVMTHFDEHSKLWYHRTFSIPPSWRGRRVRLHFGAVDWRCEVWVNGHEIGRHQGGYDPFTFDITDSLRWRGKEDLVVAATDPTDDGDQPRGKQSRKPEGIFYTSTSGIWQTVWLEPVSAPCIDSLNIVPDVDSQSVRLSASVNSFSDNLRVQAVALADGKEAGSVTGLPNSELVLNLPNARLWSPDSPFLYGLKVTLKDGSNVLDSVRSYFGMRKIALRKDDTGTVRIALNNHFIFQLGTLDQGFWPGGIYTAPTDDAMRSDIEFLKRSGFNLIRKHVKVEPQRWYYWCDKLGMLVWQDMPSGNNA
ncbi:MAG: glycoside hydrolase family 2 protein, partial [Limisphaerales bacterium]